MANLDSLADFRLAYACKEFEIIPLTYPVNDRVAACGRLPLPVRSPGIGLMSCAEEHVL
jgi:hypothetical protein